MVAVSYTNLNMQKYYLFALLLINSAAVAQPDSGAVAMKPQPSRFQNNYSAEVGGLVSSADRTPFWLRAGQYGTVPNVGSTAFARFGTHGWLTKRDSANVRVDYGLEVVGNLNRQSSLLLPEGYLRVRGRWWEFFAGRQKRFYGLGDTLLSSGSYALSTNAIPLPRVQLGTNGFFSIPLTKRWLAINIQVSHGWFGKQDTVQGSYWHHKTFHLRIGSPTGYLRAYVGGMHEAQWGGSSSVLKDTNIIQNGHFGGSLRDYLYILTVRTPPLGNGVTLHDSNNQLGNHLGSLDAALEGIGSKISWLLYYQHPFEDKSGIAFRNIPDGLYGLRVKKLSAYPATFTIRQLTVEYLHTIDQSGPTDEIAGSSHYTGLDDYFNHAQYRDGWIYRGNTIGTPFITPNADIAPLVQGGIPTKRRYAIGNSRVSALYIAMLAIGPKGQQFELRGSVSNNLGNYRTPFAQPTHQWSGLLRSIFAIPSINSSQLIIAIAADGGGLYDASIGGYVTFRKTWGQ